MKKFWLAIAGLCLLLPSGCRSPYYADKGAALGAAAGAITGAAIGNNNGNTAAGAIIGTAVGALTGAAIGDSIDADVARNQALIEQRMGRRMAGAATIPDVIALSKAGLSDDVIVSHIKANGVAAPLRSDDLITLSSNGVSDAVIKAMQNPPLPPTYVAPASRPVVIEEHHYVVPPPYYCDPWYPHYYRPHPRHRSGVSWGVSFRN
jgi:hypothetical protein